MAIHGVPLAASTPAPTTCSLSMPAPTRASRSKRSLDGPHTAFGERPNDRELAPDGLPRRELDARRGHHGTTTVRAPLGPTKVVGAPTACCSTGAPRVGEVPSQPGFQGPCC